MHKIYDLIGEIDFSILDNIGKKKDFTEVKIRKACDDLWSEIIEKLYDDYERFSPNENLAVNRCRRITCRVEPTEKSQLNSTSIKVYDIKNFYATLFTYHKDEIEVNVKYIKPAYETIYRLRDFAKTYEKSTLVHHNLSYYLKQMLNLAYVYFTENHIINVSNGSKYVRNIVIDLYEENFKYLKECQGIIVSDIDYIIVESKSQADKYLQRTIEKLGLSYSVDQYKPGSFTIKDKRSRFEENIT